MRAALSLAIGSILLAACGGDKGQAGTEQQPIDYSQLQTTPHSTSPLTSVDENTLGRYLKNGIRLQLSSRDDGGLGNGGELPPVRDAVAGSGSFSGTNVHVEGVDEADYAKYDGSHWYVATYPQYQFNQQTQYPGFQIVATDPAAPNAEILGSFSFDKEWGDVGSLYLVQKDEATSHVAVIRNKLGNVLGLMPGFPLRTSDVATPWSSPRNSTVRVQLVDVSVPTDTVQDWEIELDGSLIDTRKIGNTLYLITRFDPWVDGLRLEYGEGAVRNNNEEVLQNIAAEQLLPHYRAGGKDYPLTRDCLVQEPVSERYGFGSLVHITAVDLTGKKVLGSTCLNSNVEVMSMAEDALYLTGTVSYHLADQKTVVHKFSLTETGSEYKATGSVDGTMGWNADPVFRMHSHDDAFRIVTTIDTTTGPEHKLTILRQHADALYVAAELPNDASPDPIGKPGEDIYAVRFTDDRAYIVTFRRTDPLYTLDLSDFAAPKILGELEIPGFATYMHPIGEGLLFTLGQSADENGRVTGIKADLFDVSAKAPRLINSIALAEANSFSEALHNLRALSLLQNGEDQLRIALPIQSTPISGLQLLEVNGISSGKAELVDAGFLAATKGDVHFAYGVSRGILHDDAVFLAHNNMVWAANWDAPENPIGPITKDPIACDTQAVPSLRVTVFGDNADPSIDFCQATVTAAWGDERYELDMVPNTDLITPPDGKPCVFVGPYEVGGAMDLHVEMPGYQPEKLEAIFVPAGICHVQTQEMRTVLKSE